ncbi:MAG: hypothetical protein RLZZ444_777 [Pseudomonadota bacterium]
MTPDYDILLDDEMRAYIRKSLDFYPADTTDGSIAFQRRVTLDLARAFHTGNPPDVTSEDSVIALADRSLPIRTYRRQNPDGAATILFFHGGGFIVGGLDSHDDVCAELCGRTGYDLVSVDYRMAPEFAHPAAFEDAVAAYDWLATRFSGRIVLVGDSAGGNLAACVAHARRHHSHPPAGQVLIYPGLGGPRDRGSYRLHAEAPLLTLADLEFCINLYAGGVDPADQTFQPLADKDFTGLPMTAVFPAECDPLASDGADYQARIEAAGGRVHHRLEQGLVHGHIRARRLVRRAGEAFDRIVEAVDAFGKGHWPY